MQNQQNQSFGQSGQGMNYPTALGYGQSTLAQFGSNPQMVRQHISESVGQGYAQGYGPQQSSAGSHFSGPMGGGNMQGASAMHAGATNPQVVQQHIAQDLGSGHNSGYNNVHAGYANQGYGGGSQSVMHAGATNPQMVQQHIAQDLGYSQMNQYGQQVGQGMGMPNQQQAQYNQAAFSQMMNAASAGVQGNQGMQNQGMQHQGMQHQGMHNQNQGMQNLSGYAPSFGQQQGGQGMFSEFASNPQMVQQHIRQDLSNNVGAMTSEQAGSYRGQGQMMQSQMNAQYGQPSGAFAQYGTSPQTVREHINQDLRFQ